MKIQDVIYGAVYIPSYIEAIINTQTFQRLKKISQLGFMFKTVENARSTRYEHCIGTYTRAKTMLDCLENNSKSIKYGKVPELYRKSVEIAALLHDIGHGPFSHTWEYACGGNYHHEENAFPCIDEIFSTLNMPEMYVLQENNKYGIELIKALIIGDIEHLPTAIPDEYRYIFEIVNNKKCKVDVDKWDYLKRDHYYLKHLCNPNLDFDDIFKQARIAADGSHIEYRYADFEKIYELFTARWSFHMNCYRMPKLLAYDKILRRIIERTTKTIDNKRLNEITPRDRCAFLQLYDENVLEQIKDDIEYKYLEDSNEMIQISSDVIYATDEEKPMKVMLIEDWIPGPGTEMPADIDFQFYGDELDKQNIKRNKKPTKIFNYFLLR